MRSQSPRQSVFWLPLTLGLLIAAIGCGSEGESADDSPSICVPDGPCEKTLILQCECCESSVIDECKETKTAACASGNLLINLSINQCKQNNQTWETNRRLGANSGDQISPAMLSLICPKGELPVDPCAPSPCQNGGTCAVDADNTAICTCADGFEGPTCETATPPAACAGDFSDGYGPRCCNEFNEPAPALPMAECTDGNWTCAEGALCSCNGEVATANCISACDGKVAGSLVCVFGNHWECMNQTPFFSTDNPNPCQNDGECSADDNGAAVCTCPEGFEGTHCETAI
jgi:hypothetical protein